MIRHTTLLVALLNPPQTLKGYSQTIWGTPGCHSAVVENRWSRAASPKLTTSVQWDFNLCVEAASHSAPIWLILLVELSIRTHWVIASVPESCVTGHPGRCDCLVPRPTMCGMVRSAHKAIWPEGFRATLTLPSLGRCSCDESFETVLQCSTAARHLVSSRSYFPFRIAISSSCKTVGHWQGPAPLSAEDSLGLET